MGRAGGGSRGGGGGGRSFSGGSRSSGRSFSSSGSNFSRSGVGSSGSNFNRNNGGRSGGSFGGLGNIGGHYHRPPRPINVYPRYGGTRTVIINNGGNQPNTNPAGQNQTANTTGTHQASNAAGTAQQTYTPKPITPEQKLAREQRMAKEAAENKKSSVKWLFISAVLLVVGFVFALLSEPKEFEKYDLNGTVDVGYTYDDGFTEGSGMTEAACNEFYLKTGIPLFFYTVSQYDKSVSTCDDYTTDLYDDLFKDENHVLLAYYDNVNWWSWEIGKQVEDIITDYEVERLLDKIDEYWDDSLSNDAVLASGIASYQEDFLTVGSGSDVIVMLLFIVGFPMFLVSVIRFFNNGSKAKKHEEEAKKLEREIILSKPLETFGDSEIDDLKNKYDNM